MWKVELPRGRSLVLNGHPKVMGVLNITPDSFSDGGENFSPPQAIQRGLAMVEQGAEILDLGAESTRPGGGVYGEGASNVPVEEEWQRLRPVLEGLRRETDAPISVDTRKGDVARRALEAGADLINDVGGLQDEKLVEAVADAGCPVVIMHSRGDLGQMQRGIRFENVVQEVSAELEKRVAIGQAKGIATAQMILDPGIGFGKTYQHNLELLGWLEPLAALGHPILIGASRKSFIDKIHPAPPAQRLGGSLAAVAWAARLGASIVRVHDVLETTQFLAVSRAIETARAKASG